MDVYAEKRDCVLDGTTDGFRHRFYFDPNSTPFDDNFPFTVVEARNFITDEVLWEVQLRWNEAQSRYETRCRVEGNSSLYTSAWLEVEDGVNIIENWVNKNTDEVGIEVNAGASSDVNTHPVSATPIAHVYRYGVPQKLYNDQAVTFFIDDIGLTDDPTTRIGFVGTVEYIADPITVATSVESPRTAGDKLFRVQDHVSVSRTPSAQFTAAPDDWDAVGTPDKVEAVGLLDDSKFVKGDVLGEEQWYQLFDSPFSTSPTEGDSLSSDFSAKINAVFVEVRRRSIGAGTSLKIKWRISSNPTYIKTQTISTSASFATFFASNLAHPTESFWTPQDYADLEVGFEIVHPSGSEVSFIKSRVGYKDINAVGLVAAAFVVDRVVTADSITVSVPAATPEIFHPVVTADDPLSVSASPLDPTVTVGAATAIAGTADVSLSAENAALVYGMATVQAGAPTVTLLPDEDTDIITTGNFSAKRLKVTIELPEPIVVYSGMVTMGAEVSTLTAEAVDPVPVFEGVTAALPAVDVTASANDADVIRGAAVIVPTEVAVTFISEQVTTILDLNVFASVLQVSVVLEDSNIIPGAVVDFCGDLTVGVAAENLQMGAVYEADSLLTSLLPIDPVPDFSLRVVLADSFTLSVTTTDDNTLVYGMAFMTADAASSSALPVGPSFGAISTTLSAVVEMFLARAFIDHTKIGTTDSLIATGNDFGGIFHAGTEDVIDRDRDAIENMGFVIFGEEPLAGYTRMFVYGSLAAVSSAFQNPELHRDLPHWFFPLVEGEVVNLERVQEWVPTGETILLGF